MAQAASDLVVIKGNWDAILTGEATPDLAYADLLTAEAVLTALADFYPESALLAAAGDSSRLGGYFRREQTLKEMLFGADRGTYAAIWALPRTLRRSSRVPPGIQYLESLPTIWRLPDLDLVLVHGGLPSGSEQADAPYRVFCDTCEQAVLQVGLAQRLYGQGKMAHGHTHQARIICEGRYEDEIAWETPYHWELVAYLSLPAAGRNRKTARGSLPGYALIDSCARRLTFNALPVPSSTG